jgi:hypothetical protein
MHFTSSQNRQTPHMRALSPAAGFFGGKPPNPRSPAAGELDFLIFDHCRRVMFHRDETNLGTLNPCELTPCFAK